MDHVDKTAPHYRGETPEMLAAFNIYLNMGEKRSIDAVAKEIKRSKNTVHNWSKRYDWKLRVVELQEQANDAAKEGIKDEFFKSTENLMAYKYELLGILKKQVSRDRCCVACETSPATISEVVRVLEVVKTELGEPTSIAKGTFKEDRDNPFAGVFAQFFGAKNADADAAD